MHDLALASHRRPGALALVSSLLVMLAACGDDTGGEASGTGGMGGADATGASASTTTGSTTTTTTSGQGAGATTSTSTAASGATSTSSGACVPDCEGRVCGDDGCGDACGSCGEDQACNGQGACIDVDPGSMSFFVTSEGNITGDFGGVSGADAYCQDLADAVGAGDRSWRAYVSASGGVDARDRIGAGPWFDAAGSMVAESVADLHASGLFIENALDETGEAVPNGVTHPGMNEHDILTGSSADGTFSGSSCADYTSSSQGDVTTVGHCDASSDGSPAGAWNSAHVSNGCDETSLFNTGSSARLYCFAE